ncbi:MAG: hypothetical protein RR051_06800 [Clostridiales bacterium]
MERESLLNQYWTFLTDLRFQIDYHDLYAHHARTINGWLSGISIFLSSAAIAAWSIWSQYPLAWSALVALGQILQVIKPLLPYSHRLTAINYYVPELKLLSVTAEYRWNRNALLTDEQLAAALREDKSAAISLESRYFSTCFIPGKKRLDTKASLSLDLYAKSFEPFHNEGGETIVKQGSESQTSSDTAVTE